MEVRNNKKLRVIKYKLHKIFIILLNIYRNKKNLYKYNKIKEKSKEKNNKKGVIYTCITGDYDLPKIHSVFSEEWDYILFTDNIKLLTRNFGMWEVRKIRNTSNLSSHYLNRKYKFFPQLYLKEYKKSIYVDGNIRIVSMNFFKDIDEIIKRKISFAAGRHPERKCLYEEAKICIEQKKDRREIIKNQVDIYITQKFPKNFGLYDASILYRDHKDKKILNLMKEWWREINNYSKRDQLSLTYCIWKMGIKINYLGKSPYRSKKTSVLIERHLK